MIHEEGFFHGATGADVYYQYWLPEGNVKAVVIVAHGLDEHSGRYLNVVNRLVPLGYAAYAVDHLGHGRSDGPRTYVRRFEDFTVTLRQYVSLVARRQPGKPTILLGHSMGGLISAVYLIEGQRGLAGAVLSGPLIRVAGEVPRTLVMVVKVLSVLAPWFRVVPVDAQGVSRDPAVVRAYIEDPLVSGKKTTARLAAELSGAMDRVALEAGKITLPLLIVQGGADRLVDPEGSRMLYERVSSPDKTFKVYDGLYHEVFNEPEKDTVLGDVATWIEARISGSRP